MRVEKYYQAISKKYNAVHHKLPLQTYSERLQDLQQYLIPIAKEAYLNKEAVKEMHSVNFFKDTTILKFPHEPYIKKLSRLFGVRTFWEYRLDLWGSPVASIKALGLENQVKAFFSVVEFIVTFIKYDRTINHKTYNRKLAKYRKVERKYPGKLTKPPKFIDFYSERELEIEILTNRILDNLLDKLGVGGNLPFYDQIDFYIEEMKLQRPFTTILYKNNRRIW